MLIPYSTDAPIYHFPWVTVTLIVINLGLFLVGITPNNEAAEAYALHYGEGLHPIQWLSASFLHDGLLALLTDMLFLWTFGLVIEGKIGGLVFLALYATIAVLANACEQTLMAIFGHDQFLAGATYSCGTSPVIYGLLGVALIWAPKNEMNCLMWFGRPTTIEIEILSLAGLYVLLQTLIAVISGFWVLSALSNLIGVVLGLAAGLLFLKLGWVDCENWDLLAVIAGREGEAPSAENPEPEPADDPHQRALQALEHIRKMIEQGQAAGALALNEKMSRLQPAWRLPEAETLRLIGALHQQKLWRQSLPLMAAYVRDYPEHSTRMRLRLAEVLIDHEQRPRAGLEVLAKILPGSLPANFEQTRLQLEERARQLDREGSLELDSGEEW